MRVQNQYMQLSKKKTWTEIHVIWFAHKRLIKNMYISKMSHFVNTDHDENFNKSTGANILFSYYIQLLFGVRQVFTSTIHIIRQF